MRHPDRVRRLVIASSNFTRAGMIEGFWDGMQHATFADMPQPYKDAYLAINPSQAGVHAMFERDVRRMQAFQDIPADRVRTVSAPALVVAGDRDVIRPEHVLELARLLPNGRPAILPGTHGSYLGEILTPDVGDRTVGIFADLVRDFLDGPA
jgi:pimeloyl-ACP methyl ester carboxylesterase